MSDQDNAKRKQARPEKGQRFPYIPLSRAIEKAKELYTLANVHDVAVKIAVKHWGFSEKSSGGMLTVSALKTFGLIDDIGSSETRKIKLSAIALKIIKDPREISPERDSLIKQCALLPSIHQEILGKYDGIPPSDEVFKTYLLLDKGMQEEAANAFAKEFTNTMSFAKISDSGTIPEMDREEDTHDSGIGQKNLMPPSSPLKTPSQGGKLMDGERVVFTEIGRAHV